MRSYNYTLRLFATVFFLTCSLSVSARHGAVHYDWGAQALETMGEYIFIMMEYVLGLLYSVASLIALYSATGMYVKMQTGETGITKNILVLVGAVLFLIGASLVLPAFFGLRPN